ncbi:HPF/RaiA family ribosome-associated protein [Umezawaea sp. Da 62-37]|uniref:HPF/RaiA family ribosome-associated protein n=1 Tax=Umezawaea sp. Da 62-37 TaxID=3075927 RepID=UPI0028F74D01|nr:HPF/RaiA family ribosome-associated protein [Umezawaea sp. Da 62-37]WNV90445.1 HPF/RaiA family ribosome-associated protein [Umezawaea sp. Da 62-37]
MSDTEVLEQRLRLGNGFSPTDQGRVVYALANLAPHLAGWQPQQVDLALSVKERGQKDQKVTFEAFLAGWPPFVATSHEVELDHALTEVRKEMIRQIEDAKSRREPRKHDKPQRPAAPDELL